MGGRKVRASLAQAADGVKVIKRGASPVPVRGALWNSGNRKGEGGIRSAFSYRAGSNSSIGLPSGSSIWICLPPGPVSMSLRK